MIIIWVEWYLIRVFGILLQIHQKNLGIGQTPPLFGNAKIFTAPVTALPPLAPFEIG